MLANALAVKMILRAEFPNGHFGDPALYLWEINGPRSLLFDCGDLSRFTVRQLLKVTHIFLSHCHIDHFFGFDTFLRLHVGSEKTVTIMGPPETSLRVKGKLQGYTWNLVYDQALHFIVNDLDPVNRLRHVTHFRAANAFTSSEESSEPWDPEGPVLDVGTYRVHAAMIDHRTASVSYAVEEKNAVEFDAGKARAKGLLPGPWIEDLKSRYFSGSMDECQGQLASELLIAHGRQKIVYVTDGAASSSNREVLGKLMLDADALFAETCFLEADRGHADTTKHFTTEYIGRLAQEAGVKKLIPIHFSKRYLDCPDDVLAEISRFFKGELVRLVPASPRIGVSRAA